MAIEYIEQGLSRVEYNRIHVWLAKNFIKPDCCERCESENKNSENKKLYYALIRGMIYDFKRENFIVLCASCHGKYDRDEANRIQIPTPIACCILDNSAEKEITKKQKLLRTKARFRFSNFRILRRA